ncbi:MAG: 50S ribosome-binding GTPase, partial [Bacteroidaceae bacterium]|nr:50S ribosome-binding GTPase [Bacteroidaceae bacterium]
MEIGTIKKLSAQLGCSNVYEKLNSRMKMLEGSSTRISITGGHSGGKSSLINALLGTHEEVSLLPTYKTTRFVRKGLSFTDDAGITNTTGAIHVTEVDSAWMQAQKLEVWELSDLDVEGEMTLIQLGEHSAHTDVCVMLLNAMMPLSRTEMTKIEALEKLSIPTLLVFSMADRMQEGDYQEVAKYVKQKTSSFHTVKVLAPEKPMPVEQ